MQLFETVLTSVTALSIVGVGMALTPLVFAGRLLPGVTLGGQSLAGVPRLAVAGVVAQYERELHKRPVTVVLRGKQVARSLASLGVALDQPATTEAVLGITPARILQKSAAIVPRFTINQTAMSTLIQQEFATLITLPRNASLTITPARTVLVTASATGETVDLTTFAEDLKSHARYEDWGAPIELVVVSAPASVHEGEVEAARIAAQALLREGLAISDGAATWTVQPITLTRLLRFIPVPDPAKAGNQILGVTVDGEATREYLTTTIAPEINQPAIDARFARIDNLVTQFAIPQEGRALNVDGSVAALQMALLAGERPAHLAVDVTEPAIRDTADIDALGLTHLLAVGTSDFAGSPANRIHNILEGTKRYHGLLLPAGQEFSFNEFLGPVDGDHGFKPELVIKKNVTIPEFGGGLCQVSTTLFRAAVQAGLHITARRNHAYAVRYYGTPGFDATIYPPYTDLRFTNNTPGYLLVQTRVEGTKLAFELWGTDDNREVVVDGPHPYGRTPDGAVKATLTQKVTKNGELIVDDTFYSRYQSPNLFPKPSTNAAAQITPAPTT